MANAIKDFFKKKKIDARFKLAGSGHRLNESDSGSSSSSSAVTPQNVSEVNILNPTRSDKKDLSTQKAAEAAIERIQRQQLTHSNKANTLENILREERQKITEEYKMKEKVETIVKEEERFEKRYEEFDSKQRFYCPTIELENSDQSLPMNELIEQIHDYIQNNFADDLTLMSVLTIINCNYSQNDESNQRIEDCIKTLDKVVTNLRDSTPEDMEKFKKIRKSKIEKRVLELRGGLEFLISIGFELDSNEEWLIFNAEFENMIEQMNYYKDVLKSVQQFPILLDRNCIVLDSNVSQTEDLNTEFFRLSTDEVKKEMESLTHKRELEETLRTKAMREQKQRKVNSKFSRLRFRYPDGLQLEATFRTSETLADVKNWLLERSELKEFDLKCVRDVFTDQHMSKTLQELNLMPTSALLIIYKTQ